MFDYYKEKLELDFSICWSQSSPNLFTWNIFKFTQFIQYVAVVIQPLRQDWNCFWLKITFLFMSIFYCKKLNVAFFLQAFVREENIQKNPGFILTNLRLVLCHSLK